MFWYYYFVQARDLKKTQLNFNSNSILNCKTEAQ